MSVLGIILLGVGLTGVLIMIVASVDARAAYEAACLYSAPGCGGLYANLAVYPLLEITFVAVAAAGAAFVLLDALLRRRLASTSTRPPV